MNTTTHYVIPRSISVIIRNFHDFIAVDITFDARVNPSDSDIVVDHEHSLMVHLDKDNLEESRQDNLRTLMLAFPNHKFDDATKKGDNK